LNDLGNSGCITSCTCLITYNLLSIGANLYSPLNRVSRKYDSNTSVRELCITFLISFLRVHLSPGGTLIAISSLCSVVLVVLLLLLFIYDILYMLLFF